MRKQSREVKKSAAVENHLRLIVGARHYVAESTQCSSLVNKQYRLIHLNDLFSSLSLGQGSYR